MTSSKTEQPRTATGQPTDEEYAAFKRSEYEAMRGIVVGDLICPDPSAHEVATGARPDLLDALKGALDWLYGPEDSCCQACGAIDGLDQHEIHCPVPKARAALAASKEERP